MGMALVGTCGTMGVTWRVVNSARWLGYNGGLVECTCSPIGKPGWLMQCGSLDDGVGVSWVGSGKKSARGCCNVRWLGPSLKMTFCALIAVPVMESKGLYIGSVVVVSNQNVLD